MERTFIEYEIWKYNPVQINSHESRIIEWIDNNPFLSNEKMKSLTDDEIEELYINLNLNFLVLQFGIDKCEKIFKEFVKREC